MSANRTLCFILAIGALASPTAPSAAARLFKIPLKGKTSQAVGQLGQPVISYYTPVSIGTPAKQFQIQFDLGLSEHFVPHYNWNPFKTNLHYRDGFQCKVSTTCHRTDSSFAFKYLNNKLSGKVYSDQVAFTSAYGAATNSSQHPVLEQNFLAISDASDARFKDLPVDGFFGLGLQPSKSGLEELAANLLSHRLIELLQVSLWINPTLDSAQGGELVLGGVDPSRYRGQLYWHQMATPRSPWALNLQSVTVGGADVSSCRLQACSAALSSTLNEVYGPREDVQKIYAMLGTSRQPSGLELVDCRRLASMPVISFWVDGLAYALLPTNYVRKMNSGRLFKNETCYVAIMASLDGTRGEWTLGTNFLSAYYSTYDYTHRQVGFATLA